MHNFLISAVLLVQCCPCSAAVCWLQDSCDTLQGWSLCVVPEFASKTCQRIDKPVLRFPDVEQALCYLLGANGQRPRCPNAYSPPPLQDQNSPETTSTGANIGTLAANRQSYKGFSFGLSSLQGSPQLADLLPPSLCMYRSPKNPTHNHHSLRDELIESCAFAS